MGANILLVCLPLGLTLQRCVDLTALAYFSRRCLGLPPLSLVTRKQGFCQVFEHLTLVRTVIIQQINHFSKDLVALPSRAALKLLMSSIPPAKLKYMEEHPNDDRAPGIIACGAVCLVTAVIVVAMRFISRRMTRASLGLDDLLTFIALVLSSPIVHRDQNADSARASSSLFRPFSF